MLPKNFGAKLSLKFYLSNLTLSFYVLFVLFLKGNIFECQYDRSIPFILCSNPKYLLCLGQDDNNRTKFSV